ncbi:MAG TPA: hypothetical protein VFC11_03900 [Methylocella sp.]|nr:hypothetical protein [Methylocella sp.]
MMMNIDVKRPSTNLIETLRQRIAELEVLEASGAATPDTCEMLVDLQDLLDKLDRIMPGRVSNTSH